MSQSFVADRAEFWWDVKRPAVPVLWDSTIQLGEQFFNEIIAHPVPIDLDTLKALKRSPLGLDLYTCGSPIARSDSSDRYASRGGNSTGSSARTRRRRAKLLSRLSAGIVYAS